MSSSILAEDRIENQRLGYSRTVWLRQGGGAPRQLCVFLDGDWYIERMGAADIVARLQAEGAIPEVAAVFVSHGDARARFRNFVCRDEYAAFVACDLVQWARGKIPSLESGGHVVCGLSLSGLASAWTGLCYPDVFPMVLSQSPSFWWNDEWFAGHVAEHPVSSSRFWVSVGGEETAEGVDHGTLRQDVSQIAAAQRGVHALRAAGVSTHYNVFAGGHDFAHWAEELPAALTWLLGGNGTEYAG